MSKYIIVTDKVQSLAMKADCTVVSASDFIRNTFEDASRRRRPYPKVINLCSSFDYLSRGYYVSLLAEARGLQCLPHVSNLITLNWKRNYEFALSELNDLLKKHFTEPGEEPFIRTYTSYFGRHDNPMLEPLTRRLFDLFRFPVLAFEIKYVEGKQWVVTKVDTGAIHALGEERLSRFQNALDKFTGTAWRSPSNKKPERYWIAILHDPSEALPPSNRAALAKFVKVGKQINVRVELITKQDFASLLEYDALLIRETTAINNHTYRFAAKAAQEDIPCIDDPTSIIRCCNKVFLHELLQAHHIAMPGTQIIDRHTPLSRFEAETFPVVLKIPDGAFSRGVHKAENMTKLKEIAAQLLKKSEVILCQEFVASEFDWRIGVLNGEPLFASKYFMASGHWQIINHSAKTKSKKLGDHASVPIDQVPEKVLKTALKAAKLIGDGLYGVDLKQTKKGDVVVMEVNDNPNIDVGVEDLMIGDELYKKILEHLVTKIEA